MRPSAHGGLRHKHQGHTIFNIISWFFPFNRLMILIWMTLTLHCTDFYVLLCQRNNPNCFKFPNRRFWNFYTLYLYLFSSSFSFSFFLLLLSKLKKLNISAIYEASTSFVRNCNPTPRRTSITSSRWNSTKNFRATQNFIKDKIVGKVDMSHFW